MDASFAGAHNNLGTTLARQGKVDEAIVHFRKALDLNRGDAGAEANLGGALLSQG